uniref:Uncharacterized protein n=1 Tax=Anopheles melas TaxID=34690 RepID=A0A182TVP9_9DIPT
MACLSSSNRACVRVVQEKLCQLLAVSKGPLGQQQQQRDLSLPASGPVVNVGGDGGGGGGGHRAALLSAGSGGTPLVAHSVSGPIKRSFYTGRGNFIQPAAALAPARAGVRVPVGTGALFELNQVSANISVRREMKLFRQHFVQVGAECEQVEQDIVYGGGHHSV